MEIYPSLISADLLKLGEVIKNLSTLCDGYHIDIMDNHFVPNLTWGAGFVKSFLKATGLPLDVHLMVDDPMNWLDKFDLRLIDTFIFHYEPIEDLEKINKLIDKVKDKKWKVGIAINPATDVDSVEEFLSCVDQVLIMSVEPGFSGQDFISSMKNKIIRLADMKMVDDLKFKICVDGGVDKGNIKMLSEIGVQRCGVASAIFSDKDYLKDLSELYDIVESEG